VSGIVTLGYWKEKEKLLLPLDRGVEKEAVDSLLLKVDKVCMYLFPYEQEGERNHPEDVRSGAKEF
jgi:hypothetical protein